MLLKKHIQINAFLIIIVFTLILISGQSFGNIDIITDSTKTIEPSIEVPVVSVDSTINFNLTSDIYYTKTNQFRTMEGKYLFTEGWKQSEELKKLFSETDSLRVEYAKSAFSENKASISSRVIELEGLAINKKSTSDSNYVKAREYELNYWNKAPELEKWKLMAQNDSIKLEAEKKAMAQTLSQKTEQIEYEIIEIDTTSIDSAKIQTIIPEIDSVKTGIIVFKVQIGAYNTELPESAKKLYKKISVFRKIDQYIDERKNTVYTIGELTNVKDAIKLQDQIRQESVKDAFVIAIKDGKRIPLNEALELTK
jgi:hypothetical protein